MQAGSLSIRLRASAIAGACCVIVKWRSIVAWRNAAAVLRSPGAAALAGTAASSPVRAAAMR